MHSCDYVRVFGCAPQHPFDGLGGDGRALRNLLRRWVVEAERTGASVQPRVEKPARAPVIEGSPAFVPVAIAAKSDEGSIQLEVRRGSSTIIVQWPASAAQVCHVAA